MAGLIPMNVERILAINNLPQKLKVNSIWSDQHKVAMEQLAGYLIADYWIELSTGAVEFSSGALTSGELALGIYTFIKMMPFLNLNSIGKGFAKKTGIEADSTEILSFSELNSYKKSLEEQALRSIKPYLNSYGKARLDKLTEKRNFTRCCIIGGSNE